MSKVANEAYLDLYTQVLIYNRAKYLPYHNNDHLKGVAKQTATLYVAEGVSVNDGIPVVEINAISADIPLALLSAAILHDVDHSGDCNVPDSVNINKALAFFNDYIKDADPEFVAIFKTIRTDIEYLLKATQFPYAPDQNNNKMVGILRDADLLYVYHEVSIGNGSRVLHQGLYKELYPNVTTVTKELIQEQLDFHDNIVWNTATARKAANSRIDQVKAEISKWR